MANDLGKTFGAVPLFDPRDGLLVRAPLEERAGWWAGAPGAAFDDASNTFFLVYRQRQPRELGRGVECRIAASDNGVTFKDIWALPKTSLGALSLERCSLLRGLDGLWRLYLSYVGEEDGRWRIDLLEADEPDRFDLNQRQPVLNADDVGGEGVKDPCVYQFGRMTYMLFSYATRESELSPDVRRARHASGDIYNTGLTRSRTGAALSGDGRQFQWIGDVSPRSRFGSSRGFGASGPAILSGLQISPPPENASDASAPRWDAYCQRISAILPLDTGGYLACYDGSASVAQNYEERAGLAHSFDLQTFYSLSPDGPALVSPLGSGSLRYVDILPVGRDLFYYYEIANASGAHELRVSVVERD